MIVENKQNQTAALQHLLFLIQTLLNKAVVSRIASTNVSSTPD